MSAQSYKLLQFYIVLLLATQDGQYGSLGDLGGKSTVPEKFFFFFCAVDFQIPQRILQNVSIGGKYA